MPFELLATGTVEPLQTVAVQPQVSGPIVRIAFREGQDVEKGQVLFQIDPRPFQAALARAEAILERDRAQEANAQQEASRYAELAKQEYVTAQQYDQARTTAAAAAATLAGERGGRSPRPGSTSSTPPSGPRSPAAPAASACGRATWCATNEATPLVTINQIRPILVRFAVPAANLPLIQQHRARRWWCGPSRWAAARPARAR